MVTALSAEFARASSTVFGTRVRARVAILLSPETRWSLLDTGVTEPSLAVEPQMDGFFAAFRSRGLGVDVVYVPADTGRGTAQLQSLDAYSVLIAPTLLIVTPALVAALEAFAARGGQLLFTMRSGSHDSNNVYVSSPLPGPLATLAGVTMDEWDPMCVFGERALNQTGLTGPSLITFSTSASFGCVCEMLEPGPTTTVLATYSSGYYSGRAAVTRNAVGSAGGGVIYAGAVIDAADYYEAIAGRLAADAGLDYSTRLPYGIETSERVGADNSTAVFVLNWNSAAASVAVSAAAGGLDVISNTPVGADGVIELEPWGVAVVHARAA